MQCKPAIATISLGQCGLFSIQEKLYRASEYGFRAVELFYDDLEALARSQSSSPTPSRADLVAAAAQVRALCDHLHIQVLNLQPLRFYEGLADRDARDQILNDVIPLWLDLLHILGGDTILIASNFLPPDPETGKPRTIGDLNIIVGDLREIAMRGAARSPPVKFAYEALAWGTHIDTWEKAWDIVQQVALPNFGLAVDTFNIAAAIYADPEAEDGRTGPSAIQNLHESLHRLVTTVDVTRLFIVQVADGERLAEPLRPGHPFHVPELPARMCWSRNARLFLCEEDRGGYLPVIEIVQAVLDMGWSGWLAYEVFSRTLADPDPKTVERHAYRASRSWSKVCQALYPGKVVEDVPPIAHNNTANKTSATAVLTW